MSSFAGLTPIVRLVIKNPFSGAAYPSEGPLAAVVDTGYDGFLGVPGSVYRSLGLDEGLSASREGTVADGKTIALRSSPAAAELYPDGASFEGLVDTWEGMDEVIAGAKFLRRFKATLDYCSGVFRLSPCP